MVRMDVLRLIIAAFGLALVIIGFIFDMDYTRGVGAGISTANLIWIIAEWNKPRRNAIN